jgi:cell division protein FtsA
MTLSHSNYICALDIASSKIAACLARLKKGRISEIFFESCPSKGIRQGVICDPIELTNSIARLLKDLRGKAGLSVKYVYVSISGADITTRHSRAIIPLAERGNKVVTALDVEKVSEQARILGSNLEEEIIHSIPHSFSIDSKKEVFNPVGLYSHRLEVDLFLVCGRTSSLESLNRIVNQAGYEIKDMFFSGIATSNVLLGRELREGVSVLCDIGQDTTELLIFNSGLLRDIRIISLGGDSLTQAIAEALRLPFALAEDLKKNYGLVGDSHIIPEDKEILLKQANTYKPVKHRVVVEVLSAKAQLLAEAVSESLKDFISSHRIDNFVVTGRTVLLEGFLEMLENNLGLPVKLGKLSDPQLAYLTNREGILSGQKYLAYATSLGLLAQALHKNRFPGTASFSRTGNPLLKFIRKTREIYQEYF